MLKRLPLTFTDGCWMSFGLYARVSSLEQRKELEAPLGRLVVYAHHHRLNTVQAESEVGSGLNGLRPKLINLPADS